MHETPLLLGGHPAIDFLNTWREPDGEPVETLTDGRRYLDWLVTSGLLQSAQASRLARRFGAEALDAAAAEARKIREWARSWLSRWREDPRADYRDELATLNRLLARAQRSREVVATDRGFQMIEATEAASAGALLALVAEQLARLLTEQDPALLRTCAGPACTLWFLDRTKAHRRVFCSASVCGNRAKVAAFRARRRHRGAPGKR